MEERWNCLRHGDGQGYQTAEVAAVLPPLSQPLATPSISEPTTEPTEYELWKSDGTASGTVMVKDISSGSGSSSPYSSQPLATPSISSRRRNQRIRIVEERWNCLRHGDGQGHLQRKWQQFSLLPHSRWQHPLFPSHDGTNGTNCGRAMEL